MWIEEVPNKEKGVLIDVRSNEEFELMHADNSVNIPWDMHLYYLEELAKLPKPWMFCCEAGYRSGLVVFSLRNLGYTEVYNVGRWFDVKANQTEKV